MKGILMTPDNAQKSHDGAKVQTRRLIKPQPFIVIDGEPLTIREAKPDEFPIQRDIVKCPYQIGEKVYIKEKWASMLIYDSLAPRDIAKGSPIWFTDTPVDEPTNCGDDMGKWRSSLHLPAALARTIVEIKNIQVQRIQDISEADAKAEGCPSIFLLGKDGELQDFVISILWFEDLWNSIHGPGAWERNDWVWKLGYEKVER